MRILVHDYSGHPFQVELSRELARRGHAVTHSYCPGWVSGKGHLVAEPGETLVFDPVGPTEPIAKDRFVRRVLLEARVGWELLRQVRRTRAQTAMLSNAQIPTLVVFALGMMLLRRPWVLWHQDVYAVAVKSFAGDKLGRMFRLVAAVFSIAERWVSRRSAAVVVIAPSFVPVHEEWGTADKVTVIPNWAPLDEIQPVARKNDWAIEQELDDTQTLLYSGTLGLKHNPALLVGLARQVIDAGRPVRLVVVNEGPAVEVIRAEAERLDVPVTLLPFQPYERLSEVLGSGDILVVLLEQQAGAFSVPSKTLSYLCAGRPVLGMMPSENLAAALVNRAGGLVVPPAEDALPRAAAWAADVLADVEVRDELGEASRDLAELEFALKGCADRFEEILERSSR
ncbi:glycosyl transferase family 1 [Nocardioides sp. J9]|uniref:glycosyltransferase family 4 protein n=1 Tax=unclassified Nocardioides TaxID=2615069 RepID=UPI000491C904|nr:MULTISPECIES: glycosyltransferase family 4 protein [unclassified Nocardioides]TWG91853.1 glycosyl transferase family 1 [Nocardioides sp. J9]